MEVSWNRGTPKLSIEIGNLLKTIRSRDPPFMETTISSYDRVFFFLHHILLTYSLHCGFTFTWVTCSSTLSGHPSSSFTLLVIQYHPVVPVRTSFPNIPSTSWINKCHIWICVYRIKSSYLPTKWLLYSLEMLVVSYQYRISSTSFRQKESKYWKNPCPSDGKNYQFRSLAVWTILNSPFPKPWSYTHPPLPEIKAFR